jgi:hypothetical protein
MTRKIYMASLFTIAVALAGLGVVTVYQDIGWAGLMSSKHWGRVGIGGGNMWLVHARTTTVPVPHSGITVTRGAMGVLSIRTGTSRNWHWASLTVPVWLVVAVLFIHPAVDLFRGPVRRRRRRRRGRCAECGYDLSGNTSGRCPECGKDLDGILPPGPATSGTLDA